MDKYFFYWMKGWKAFLMIFLANIAGLLLFGPFAIIFHGHKAAYGISCVIVYLMIGIPFLGWLYMEFVANENAPKPEHPAAIDHRNESTSETTSEPEKVYWKSDEDLE